MLSRFINYARRGHTTTAKINLEDFKPDAYNHNMRTLGQMHHLRMWNLENNPDNTRNIEYVTELEQLHNELNYQNTLSLIFKLLGFNTAIAIWYFFIYDAPVDKHDFKRNFDLKFTNKLYNELDEGGIEG